VCWLCKNNRHAIGQRSPGRVFIWQGADEGVGRGSGTRPTGGFDEGVLDCAAAARVVVTL